MQNITLTREVLVQIKLCCLEIAHGCEQLQTAEIAVSDLIMLADALRETHTQAENLKGEWEMGIDKNRDHDGDTQPANEAPEPPASFVERYDTEPPWMRDRTPCQCGHERDVHGPAGPATPTAGLVCYVVDCPCRQFAGASAEASGC